MGKTYLEGARSMSGADNWFTDKMPHNFMNIGLILLLFPNAKILHCRRDPIDTCVSIYTNGMTPAHTYYKSDLATLGTYYNHYLTLMDHWHSVFPGRILDVYYEDVIANGEHASRAIIKHLDLDWEDQVLNREGSQSAVRTLSAWQVRQPIYASAKGKWRRFEKHLGPLIDALGDSVATYQSDLDAFNERVLKEEA
jgi:hypothetical protein